MAQDPGALAPVKDLIRIPVDNPEAALQLQGMLHDIDDHLGLRNQRLTAYATDAEQADLLAAGIAFEVEIEDLTAYYAERAANDRVASLSAVGSMGGFRTLAEIEAEMDRLASTFPSLCSPKFSIGTSIEGRAIWAMRISTTPTVHDPSKAVAWYDAIHHAREPMSGESLLMWADELLSGYGSDVELTRLVQTRNTILIPCVNPDGYEYNRQIAPGGGGMWRKNMRNNGGGSYGVDLNRNYDWEWGPQWTGSSSDPWSEVYHGTAPFSEPESAAVAALMATMPPAMSMSTHTYSDLLLYPWGYDTIVSPHDSLYRSYAQSMTARSGYPFGTIWQLLYTANGGSVDYHYGQHGTIAFTPEIGNLYDGFWPAPSRIPDLYDDIRDAYRQSAMATGSWGRLGELVWTEVSGDGDAFREPNESWSVEVSLENSGLVTLDATLNLSTTSPYANVIGSGSTVSIPPGGSALSNNFVVAFTAHAPSGTPIQLDLQLDYDGWVDVTPVDVVLGRARTLVRDRMESDDFGWSTNNSTNWSWERALPQMTTTAGSTVQPGSDYSTIGSLCWVTGAAAGASVGANDVDGTAILTSPIFSLEGLSNASVHFAQWFANRPGGPLDDRWITQLSNDGGLSWVEIGNDGDTGSAWVERTLDLSTMPFTDAMQLRFLIADEPNNDITEALLDDLEVRTLQSLPTVGYWGGTSVGQTARLTVDGAANAPFDLAWSLQQGGGISYPGIEGQLFLQNAQVFQSGTCDADGLAQVDMAVPSTVSGRTVYLQALVGFGNPEASFSTVSRVTFP